MSASSTRSVPPDANTQPHLDIRHHEKQPLEVSQKLTDRVEKYYHQTKMLRQFVQNASAKPVQLVSSVVSLGVGVQKIYSGDIISGGIAATCGAKGLWNLCSDESGSSLERLLNDINADVGMIQVLEEANRDSCKAVQGNLDLVKKDVAALQSQLDEISRLNTQGLVKIESKREEATLLNTLSVEAYNKAMELFQGAQDKLNASGAAYETCGEFFGQIKEIARLKESGHSFEEQVEFLLGHANSAASACHLGKEHLDGAVLALNEAFTEFKKARDLKDQTAQACCEAVQMAKDALQAGIDKAAYTKECQGRIDEMQNELAKVQERSKQIMALIKELKRDVAEAKREAAGKFSLSEVAVGIGVAAAMATPLGITYGAATGISAMYALHHGETVSWGASKIYNWAMGISEPEVKLMEPQELISFDFDKSSSGYWGRFVQQRPSVTVGTLKVNLGNGAEIPIRFNLNQRDKIAKEDLLNLFEVMNGKVASGELESKRCLDILHALETVEICRGALHSAEKGMIKASSPTYAVVALLKEACEKRMLLPSKEKDRA